MGSYILSRVGRAVFTLLIFETLLFFLILAGPGDDVIIKVPAAPAPGAGSVQATPGAAVTEPVAQPTKAATTPCEPPVKGLDPETIAGYKEDCNRGMILQGVPTEESESQPGAPAVTEVPVQQAAVQTFLANPTAFQQFTYWIRGLARGDLGFSTTRRKPVIDVLSELAPRTLLLILPGALIGFFLGLRLGAIVSWKRGSVQESAMVITGVALFTAFPPWLSFFLATIFAYNLNWLPRENIISADINLWAPIAPNRVISWLVATMVIVPVLIYALWRVTRWMLRLRSWLRIGGVILILGLTLIWWVATGFTTQAWDILRHLVLPMVTLILLTFGGTMLLMQTSMTEIIQEIHVLAAKAKGLPEPQVRDNHAARLALIPVVSRFILDLPLVIISTFAIEKVFYWNGLGQFLFEAANNSDYPLVLGILTVVGVVILVAHLFVDLLNLVLDPRLRKFTKLNEGG